MAIKAKDTGINDVIKALGLAPERVFSFRLDINVGEIVTVTAGMLVSPEQMKKLGQTIPKIMTTYELTEREK